MTVIRTDNWSLDDPLQICENLESILPNHHGKKLYEHLLSHGMYRPDKRGKEHRDNLIDKNVWGIIQQEEKKLKRLWNGPDVPIFIFPSNSVNPSLRKATNGKSGVAFKDKLFLFVSNQNTSKEVKALFTHEYNHVCRLTMFDDKESTLLDSIIIEGLAEVAVQERYGEEFLAPWATYYSSQQLEHMWKKFILPNRAVSKKNGKHDKLLYGLGFYPKMLGYSVGYEIVRQYSDEKKLTSKELLKIPTLELAKIKG